MYNAISGVDACKKILAGCPNGGVAVLFKKSLCNKINIIKTVSRIIYGIKISFGKQIVCLLLSVYLPCDNDTSSASAKFTECIDYNEALFNSVDCNAFICCGDFNTSFERSNGQTEFLNSFITRNNLSISWNHPVSQSKFTYTNLFLNQFSCIEHIITTRNVFAYIVDKICICDTWNILT